MLKLLSNYEGLSTPKMANNFNVSTKVIQTDFKEYLIPLFNDNTIYYDYSSKHYLSSHNFLTTTNFTLEELALIAILKNKSKDKYSDKELSSKVNTLLEKYDDALSNSIYTLSDIEKIDKFKNEIVKVNHAIKDNKIITCIYRDKTRELYPLKILNLEGFWYLICFDTHYKEIRKYHLNSISKIKETNNIFDFDSTFIDKFSNAINAWYKPEKETISIQLFLDNNIAKYFTRKPISPTQRVMKTYEDDSCEIELEVTDFMEIIPTIQKFMPYILVIEPQELKETILNNAKSLIEQSK